MFSQYVILDEVDVTLENADIFGSVLSGEGGSAGGGWLVVSPKRIYTTQCFTFANAWAHFHHNITSTKFLRYTLA